MGRRAVRLTKGLRGVHKSLHKFYARICKGSENYHLGTFDTARQAAAAYNAAAIKLFGGDARLNDLSLVSDVAYVPPPKTKALKDRALQVMMTSETRNRINVACNSYRTYTSMSAFVRRAVEYYLNVVEKQ